MTQNIPHFTSLKAAIASLSKIPLSIVQKRRISGGDINDAFSLELSDGQKVFMKANSNAGVDFFEAEAAGLSAISSVSSIIDTIDTEIPEIGKIRTPKILAVGSDTADNDKAGSFSFLLLEFVDSAHPIKDYWRIFGRELAAFHKSDTSLLSTFSNGKRFGFFADNFIGQTKQENTPNDSWIDFFRDSRLVPQIKMAAHYFDNSLRSKIDWLLNHLDEFLIEPDFPSLVHGDLWRGNVLCGSDGKAMLIDPAAYVGFYEVDLAMTELFGRFPEAFYYGYREIIPKLPGYELRCDVYNLYQLLNHLNLFGAGYLGSVCRIINQLKS